MNPLPQYSEREFRRYEPFITQVIKNYPGTTTFCPTNTSTFCARIRDAVRSMAVNGWVATDFTYEQAAKVFRSLQKGGDFVFSITSDGVYCGPVTKHINASSKSGPVIALVASNEFDARNADIWQAILTLKSNGLLDQPIPWRNISAEQLNQVPVNIEFFESEPGLHLMI